MKLRIVSGMFKGRYLTLPDKAVKFRPTQERVRQALAEKIKEHIAGALAADLCAGSGAFGFELLSRGAKTVHFVERDRMYGRKIVEHAGGLNAGESCVTYIEDVAHFIGRCDVAYDIIFYDPPYEDAALALAAPQLLKLLSPGGILIYEHDFEAHKASVAAWPADLEHYSRESRRYGNTAVDFFFRR